MRTYAIPLKNAFLSVYLSPCEKETPNTFLAAKRKREPSRQTAPHQNGAGTTFLKKKKERKTRNDLDVNRANSTSPRIFELRNAFLVRGIPDILRLLPWWRIISARRLATLVTFAFPLSSWTLERGDARRGEEERPLSREISVPGSGCLRFNRFIYPCHNAMVVVMAEHHGHKASETLIAHKEERYFATLNPLLLTFSPGCTPR